MVKTLASNEGHVGLIPGQGYKTPHSSRPKNVNRSSILTNSMKTFRTVYIKKLFIYLFLYMVWGHYLGLVVFLLDYVCAELLQLCLTLCYPVDYRPRDFSVHGILQARILEWVAMPISRGSS